MGTSLGHPIQINLDGSFAIPRDGVPYVVGDINPDLRLEHLDAFLEQLNKFMGRRDGERRDLEVASIPSQIDSAFARVIADAAKGIKMKTEAVSCILEVDCEINPATNTMKYKFCVTGELR
jgi:hypothetical protein